MTLFTPTDNHLSNIAPSESKVSLTSVFSYPPSSIFFPSKLALSFDPIAGMCRLLCPVLSGTQLTPSHALFSGLGLDPSGALSLSTLSSLLCTSAASTLLVSTAFSCHFFCSLSCKGAFSVCSLSFALCAFGSVSQF